MSEVLKYEQTLPTTHKIWLDNKQFYGLNFHSKDEAYVFAAALTRMQLNEERIIAVKKWVTAWSKSGFSKV